MMAGAAGAAVLAGCATPEVASEPLRIALRTTPELVTAEIRNVSGEAVEIVDYEDTIEGAPEQILIRVRMTEGIALNQSREEPFWWNPAILISTAVEGPAPTTVLAPGATLVLNADPHELMLGMAPLPSIRGVEYQVRVVVHRGGGAPMLLASQTSAWTTLN
jgi:hypothetical protein